VAVIALTRRGSAWGFGAGCLVSALWNYINLAVTNFISSGLHELAILVQTGRLARPDQLVAVIAAGGPFVLFAAGLWGFLPMRPGARRWLEFAGGGIAAIAYFVAIIVTTGPQYIGLLKRVVGQ